MKYNHCVHLRELVKTQIPAIEGAIKRNRHYLGEISKHYIGKQEAENDFFRNHLLPYLGEIFKALFCTYKCPDGNNCEVTEQYHDIAQIFRKEVEKLGIKRILEGGDAIEAIFTRFRQRTTEEGS